jgi:hypothetical protein
MSGLPYVVLDPAEYGIADMNDGGDDIEGNLNLVVSLFHADEKRRGQCLVTHTDFVNDNTGCRVEFRVYQASNMGQ